MNANVVADRWICAIDGHRLIVDCFDILTAYEVKHFAARQWGVDPAIVRLMPSKSKDDRPDVEVRWVGSDFSHGGTEERRRLQKRAVGAEEWEDV